MRSNIKVPEANVNVLMPQLFGINSSITGPPGLKWMGNTHGVLLDLCNIEKKCKKKVDKRLLVCLEQCVADSRCSINIH